MAYFDNEVKNYGIGCLPKEETWKVVVVLIRDNMLSYRKYKDFINETEYDGSLDYMLDNDGDNITVDDARSLLKCTDNRFNSFLDANILHIAENADHERYTGFYSLHIPKKDVLKYIYCTCILAEKYYHLLLPTTLCWLKNEEVFVMMPTEKLKEYDCVPILGYQTPYTYNDFIFNRYCFAWSYSFYCKNKEQYRNVEFEVKRYESLKDFATKFEYEKGRRQEDNSTKYEFFGIERIYSYDDFIAGKAVKVFEEELNKEKMTGYIYSVKEAQKKWKDVLGMEESIPEDEVDFHSLNRIKSTEYSAYMDIIMPDEKSEALTLAQMKKYLHTSKNSDIQDLTDQGYFSEIVKNGKHHYKRDEVVKFLFITNLMYDSIAEKYDEIEALKYHEDEDADEDETDCA